MQRGGHFFLCKMVNGLLFKINLILMRTSSKVCCFGQVLFWKGEGNKEHLLGN